MKFSFENKRVLVTGAAHGLGAELTLKLLARGAEVLAIDRDRNALNQLAKNYSGDNLSTYLLDLTATDEVLSMHDKVRKNFGPIDVLINNAGIAIGGEFHSVSAADHLRTIDVNLKAMIQMTHLFFADLLASKDSLLLQIGSVTGMLGLAYGTSYSSSKWGVLGFSESLRQELRAEKRKKPHILVVCPSYISTGMFEGAKAPKLMPFLKTAKLAETILRAAESRKHFVKEPWIVKTVPLLRAALPLWLQDLIFDWFGVAKGMHQWKGRTQTTSSDATTFIGLDRDPPYEAAQNRDQ